MSVRLKLKLNRNDIEREAFLTQVSFVDRQSIILLLQIYIRLQLSTTDSGASLSPDPCRRYCAENQCVAATCILRFTSSAR